MPQQNSVELEIVGTAHDGRGVARLDGLAVFVPYALEGERVLAELVQKGGRYAVARVTELLSPSPARTAPACPVYGDCGGCGFQHMSYAEELRVKRARVADALRRIGGLHVEIPPVLGADSMVRNKATLPLAERCGRVEAGFYAGGSHRLVPHPEGCALYPPVFRALADAVCGYAQAHGLRAGERGSLRRLSLRLAETTGEVSAALYCAPGEQDSFAGLAAALRTAAPAVACICAVPEPGGPPHFYTPRRGIEDVLCGNRLRISPLSFYQVNRRQAERLYETAAALAGLCPPAGAGSAAGPQMDTAVDLCCGIGSITLYLARLCGRVYGAEINPNAIENARVNAALNNIENVSWKCADAAAALRGWTDAGVRPRLVCVDPPRAGLDGPLRAALLHAAPAQILYISCDPATLARDCKELCAGGYTPAGVQPVDMFARTAHVECVVMLERKNR